MYVIYSVDLDLTSAGFSYMVVVTKLAVRSPMFVLRLRMECYHLPVIW